MRAGLRVLAVALVLAGCGESPQQKPPSPPSPPIRAACATPEQAGQKAADVTKKLLEALDAKLITEADYRVHDATLGAGRRAWAEHQDLAAYCAALAKVMHDAELR